MQNSRKAQEYCDNTVQQTIYGGTGKRFLLNKCLKIIINTIINY